MPSLKSLVSKSLRLVDRWSVVYPFVKLIQQLHEVGHYLATKCEYSIQLQHEQEAVRAPNSTVALTDVCGLSWGRLVWMCMVWSWEWDQVGAMGGSVVGCQRLGKGSNWGVRGGVGEGRNKGWGGGKLGKGGEEN